jgi:hypothetical protein
MSKYTKKRHVRRTRKHGRRKSQKGSGGLKKIVKKILGYNKGDVEPEWLDLRNQVLDNDKRPSIFSSVKLYDEKRAINEKKEKASGLPRFRRTTVRGSLI